MRRAGGNFGPSALALRYAGRARISSRGVVAKAKIVSAGGKTPVLLVPGLRPAFLVEGLELVGLAAALARLAPR